VSIGFKAICFANNWRVGVSYGTLEKLDLQLLTAEKRSGRTLPSTAFAVFFENFGELLQGASYQQKAFKSTLIFLPERF
jgi:hypothetical protein